MRKSIAWSLILCGCMSGCDVSAVITKPPAERVTKNGLKSSVGKVQTLTPKAKQTDEDAEEPTTQASTGGAAAETADNTVSEQPAASAANDSAAEVAETTLKLIEAANADIGMIPVLADDGSVASLLYQNDRSTITWKVEATRGPSALTVSKVKLTLTPEAWYPAPQDPFASEEGVASDTEEATEASEVEEATPPQVVELQPAELGWATAIAAGTTVTLTYETNVPAIRSFLQSHFGVSRFSLKMALLDASGEPLIGESDEPFTLEQSIQVL